MPMKRSPQDSLTLRKRALASMYPSATKRRPASEVTTYIPARLGINMYTGYGTNVPFTAYGVLSGWTGVDFTIARGVSGAAHTAEGFFKPTGSADQTLFQYMADSGNTVLRISYSSGLVWATSKVVSPASQTVFFVVSNGLVLNRWNHVAFSKTGSGTGTLYINGNSVGSSITLTEDATQIALGYDAATGLSAFSGSITNFRHVIQRLYSSNFTVPSLPLTAVPNTAFLLVSTPTVKYEDSSGNTGAITYQTAPTWTAGPITYP